MSHSPSNELYQFLHRPQQLWWRKVMFQIHLWVGIVLALYVVVIGLTGSILVFREELTAASHRELFRAHGDPTVIASIETVYAQVRAAYPDDSVQSIFLPYGQCENYTAYLSGPRALIVFADSADGHVIGQTDRARFWISWVQKLHFCLLAGSVGELANGICAALLLILCLTGLILWWPGLRNWTQALSIRMYASWRRVNYDAHRAVGFWTLAIVCMWAVTGMTFVWSRQAAELVNYFSPVTNAEPPSFTVAPAPVGTVPLAPSVLIQQALVRYPQTQLEGVLFPKNAHAPLVVMLARETMGNTRATNYLYFDPLRGRLLGAWERGINRTAGDSLVSLFGPIHFGVYWGVGVKAIWALAGLSLPLLSITGLLMYWNLKLRRAM